MVLEGRVGLRVDFLVVFIVSFLVLFFQVEDFNVKWQRYDVSRDEYVRGFYVQLRGLQFFIEFERFFFFELMRKEIFRFNRQVEEKMNDCVEVRQELAVVRRVRDAALERVQMLEQQVFVFGFWGVLVIVVCGFRVG